MSSFIFSEKKKIKKNRMSSAAVLLWVLRVNLYSGKLAFFATANTKCSINIYIALVKALFFQSKSIDSFLISPS